MSAHAMGAYPSPGDWRDEVIYQVITDRFCDGNPANNNAENSFNPSNSREAHGGDWKGLKSKLEYIKTLGATAIWISPVVLNKRGSYHGYAAKDFNSYSPMFGDLKDLRDLIDAAHARGIRVIIDMVCNHTADYIGSDDPGWPQFRNPSPYTLRFKSPTERQAPPFDNLNWYHNNGRIDQFIDPNQILGELSGLDDLKTELPEVRDALTASYEQMILKTDCDGFRIDTVKHVEHGFWQTWCPRITKYCASIGKDNFIMFGEVLDGDDAKCASYTGTRAGGAPELNSLLYYPMYFATKRVFESDAPTREISKTYSHLDKYDSVARRQLVTFLDNHDQPRFLSSSGVKGDSARLKAALTFETLSLGVPCIYYGTEQAFEGDLAGRKSNDPFDREDMFAGKFEFGTSAGDNFNETHPLFLWVQRLLDLRRTYPMLRKGDQKERWNSPSGPGVYAFSRILGNDEAIIAVNSSPSPQGPIVINSGLAPGVPLINAITGEPYGKVLEGGRIPLHIDACGSLALMPASSYHWPEPAVNLVSPNHDATSVDATSGILVQFNMPMDAPSVAAAFSISPAAPGSCQSISPSGYLFKPATPLNAQTVYTVSITTGAREFAPTHRHLRGVFESRFTSAPSPSAQPAAK